MNKKLHNNYKNQKGFAHPVLLVVLLVAVIGVVGYSGHRVIQQRNQQEQVTTQSPQGSIKITAESAEEVEVSDNVVSIQSSGTAAQASTSDTLGNSETESLPESIDVADDYEVASPIGSLSQLIDEVKNGNYSSALYFITPKLMFNAYEAMEAYNLSDFAQNCQFNSICQTLLSSDIEIDLNHINDDYCAVPDGSGFSECRKIWTKFVLEGNTLKTVYYKTVGFHVHTATMTMLKSPDSANWVIDSVSVDDFSL